MVCWMCAADIWVVQLSTCSYLLNWVWSHRVVAIVLHRQTYVTDLHGINRVCAGKKCRFGCSSVALIFCVFGFSSLRSWCFLHSQLFILVMKRGSGPDRVKSSWCLCCSHSHCSWRISSVSECAGVWLFWSVSAKRGCSWQGCIWVIASKHWEDVLYCIAGHETADFQPPPPCSLHLGGTIICSNRSGLCCLTWLTSRCKYNHSLLQLSWSVWGVLVKFSIPGCCC